MPVGPLMYKFLVVITLLMGVLSLAVNLLSGRRSRGRPHRLRDVIRAPFSPTGALLGAPAARRAPARGSGARLPSDLTPEQYRVTRLGGTERPFTGQYWDCYEEGVYRCVGCGQDLFDSGAKFDSGDGWPSFRRPVRAKAVDELKNISYGVVRTEVVCSRCEAHLGQVFADRAQATGLRYGINSAALDFRPVESASAAAFG